MKKALLSLVVLCVAFNLCTAQTPYESLLLSSPYQFLGANDNAIVRMCNDRYAVAYRTKYDNMGMHSYFCLLDFYNFNVSDTIFPQKWIDYENSSMQNIVIRDMRVLGEYLAFCGYRHNPAGGKGVIGYFKWTELLNNTVNITYDTVDDINSVNKMVLYKDLYGNMKIVAIGTSGYGFFSNHIITKDDLLDSSLQYFYNPSPTQYIMTDIVEVNNFVAFFIPQDSDGNICIRRTDKSNIFCALLDTVYIYHSPGEANGLLYATHLDKNDVAVSYVHPMTGINSTRLRMFNIENMTNFNSQEIKCLEKYEPYEMVFYPTNKELILLHDQKENNSNVNYFVYFKPYLTSYITKKLNHHNVNFHTISLYGNKFVSATGQKWYIQNLLATFPWNQWCPEIYKETVVKVEPLFFEIQPNELSSTFLLYNTHNDTITVGPDTNDINCNYGGNANNNR